MDGDHDGCDDEHGGESDHDLVRKVVQLEEEGEVADEDEQESLEERVRHVILHQPLEGNLDGQRAVIPLVDASFEIGLQYFVLHKRFLTFKIKGLCSLIKKTLWEFCGYRKSAP